MKKIFSKEFVIGLCVIVALVILFFGIDYLKGINLFRPANFYYASYKNVAGLAVAAPVNVDGFKVGQVREVAFDYENPGKIKVLLALDSKLRIPEDSYAMLESGLLDGAYVTIHLGKSKKMIEVGGDVPTQTAQDMMSAVSNDLLPSVASILPKVDSLLANLNRVVADPALIQSVQRLDGISANLLAMSGSLNSTMSKNVPSILSNAGRITTNLDTITGNLSELSAQLKSLPLQSTMTNVESVTGNLVAFSDKLNSSKGTLGKLMNDPELYEQLSRVTADVDSLIVDIKKNPKRYISIKLL